MRRLPAFVVGAALFALGILGAVLLADEALRWTAAAVQLLGAVVLVVSLVDAARKL